MRRMLSRFWDSIAEPKRVTIAIAIGYTLFIVQGVANCFNPLVDDLTFDAVRVAINGMLIIGGIVGSVAYLKGYRVFERPAIWMVATAYSVHLVWVLFGIGADGAFEHGKAIRIVLVLLLLFARAEWIKGSLVDHKKAG